MYSSCKEEMKRIITKAVIGGVVPTILSAFYNKGGQRKLWAKGMRLPYVMVIKKR